MAEDKMTVAGEVKQWLQDLYGENGYLTAEMVREAARDEESPAHHIVFNLPPSEAAERHYLNNARQLIRSVKVSYAPSRSKKPVTVRFFQSIPVDGEESYRYVSTADLADRPDELKLARNEAVRRLREAEHAVEGLNAITSSPKEKRIVKNVLVPMRDAREALASV